MTKQLRRSENKIIGGVCAGLGEYFDIDPVIVRIIFIALTFAAGSMILIYILAWIIIPGPRRLETSDTAVEPNSKGKENVPNERSKWFGIILVLIGFGFLLNNYDILYFWSLSKFWPLALIAVGIAILFKAFSKKEVIGDSEKI